MSDNEKSGAPSPAPADLSAPASGPADSAAPQAAPASNSAPAFGSFGSTRGSGLARGKRPASSAPASSTATPAGYKPSSLEVITPKSEYRNPFTGETSVGAPPPAEPAAPVTPAPVATAPAPAAAPAPAPAAPARPAPAPAAPEAKSELSILPPESTRRSEIRWEADGGAPRREDRGTFQPRDRRERREGGPREPRRDEGRFEPREPRREEPRLEPREHAPHRGGERTEEAPKKSGGFFGWFKRLFRRKDKSGAATHAHRGGRGHGGQRDDSRGPRPEGQHGHGEGDQGGQRRRRRRGGRGRRRDGDRGPRPEGQQGGGAI